MVRLGGRGFVAPDEVDGASSRLFEFVEGQQLGVVHHRHHIGDQVDFLADYRQEHARHEKDGAGERQDDARDYKDSGKV